VRSCLAYLFLSTDILESSTQSNTKPKPFVPNKSNLNKLKQDKEKFEMVLNHQQFRANPLATMKEHLQNEMLLANAANEESSAKSSKKAKTAKNGSKNGKKK
jgi:hypothetical protein